MFPEGITDATLLGNALYLRTDQDKVWKVDAATLVDDYSESVPAALLLHFNENYVYSPNGGDPSQPAVDSSGNNNAIFRVGASGAELPESQGAIARFSRAAAASTNGDYLGLAAPTFNLDATSQWSVEAFVYDAGLTTSTCHLARSADNTTRLSIETDGSDRVLTFRADGIDYVSDTPLPLNQWVHACVCRDGGTLRLFQDGILVAEGAIANTTWGTANMRFLVPPSLTEAGVPFYMDEMRILVNRALFTEDFVPPTEPYTSGQPGGVPFEGTLWWPALSGGSPGVNMQLDSFDLVVNGEVTVQFGYDQRDPNVLTDGYTLQGDTVPGTSIPFPMTSPSFAPKLTFAGSQAWEWFGMNLYIQDSRSSGFAG